MKRNLFIPPVIVAIVVVALVGMSVSASFSKQEETINSLQKQIVDLENQTTSLQNQVSDLQNALEIAQNVLEEERTPTLSNWNDWLHTELGVRNVPASPAIGPNRLYIQGKVWNTGNDTAYDCKLHVMLYQDEGIYEGKTKEGLYEVYMDLGNIATNATVNVDENIVYTGGRLLSWDIQPLFAKPS